MVDVLIRPIQMDKESDDLWGIMEPIIRAGETYAFPRNWTRDEALQYWCDKSHEVFVAVKMNENEGEEVVGTFFIHANQKGGGNHVANCGYMTKTGSTGRGIAREMCSFSLEHAKSNGFRSMQYNFVIKSNQRAVQLWHSMGFEIIGELPDAFNHPTLGFTNVYVMYCHL